MKSKKFYSEKEFVDYWEPYFQKVADLQYLLFSQPPDMDVNEFISLVPNFFFQSKIQLIQLFSSIYSLHFSRENHRNFCCKLLEALLPHFQQYLTVPEIVSMLEFQSKDLYLLFYKLGVITVDKIIDRIKKYDDPYDFLYFHDIIEEFSFTEYNNLKSKYIDIFNSFDFRDFKNRRNAGKNDSPIALSIREDDVEKCQAVISSSNIRIDSHIPYSIFEVLEGVNQKENMPSLLEYAAFFGSIKCFKFLIMNNSPITDKLISYAIFGGNIEIIHICEGYHAPLKLALRSSICCFRDDFFEYFQDSQDVEFTDSAICCSIRNYNISALLRNLKQLYHKPNICDDRGDYPIAIASAKNYIDILYMLISSRNIDLNVSDRDLNTCLSLSVERHHKLAFNVLIEEDKIDVNTIDLYGENILTKLVENNYTELLLKALSRKDIIILNPKCQSNEIIYAIRIGNLDAVKLFFDHIKYQDKISQMDYFKYFIISAALLEEWDIVDYLLTRCPSYLLLLKIVELFFEDKEEQFTISQTLQNKIYECSKKQNNHE